MLGVRTRQAGSCRGVSPWLGWNKACCPVLWGTQCLWCCLRAVGLSFCFSPSGRALGCLHALHSYADFCLLRDPESASNRTSSYIPFFSRGKLRHSISSKSIGRGQGALLQGCRVGAFTTASRTMGAIAGAHVIRVEPHCPFIRWFFGLISRRCHIAKLSCLHLADLFVLCFVHTLNSQILEFIVL